MNNDRISGKAKLSENDTIGIGISDMEPRSDFSRPVELKDLFVFRLCKKVIQEADENGLSVNGAGSIDVPVVGHRPSRCVRWQ